jgi:FKBP-type peptidyl-prolyl cis-trans isomerase
MFKRNIQVILLSLTAVLMILQVSCDPTKKYVKAEESEIQNYLATNFNQTFVRKPSGLYYYEVLEGTGIMPAKHDTVYVKYTGKFLEGTIFDSNVLLSSFLIFPVGEKVWVIDGLDEGVTYMKEGGKATILIPSELAYGGTGSPVGYDPTYGPFQVIPGYTPLLFEIELVHVSPGTGK